MNSKLMGVVAGGIALIVCGVSFGDISGSGNRATWSLFSLLLTDAPVDGAESVVVSVNEVQLLPRNGGAVSSFELTPPMQIDLLQLQGKSVATLVDSVATMPGDYRQLRLNIDAESGDCQNIATPFSSYISIDGTRYPLAVPGEGLLINGDIQLVAGQSPTYVMDFDLRRAVSQRGATGCYNLRPAARIVDVAASGSIVGTADVSLFESAQCTANQSTGQGAAVYVYQGRNQHPRDISGRVTGPMTTANLTPGELTATLEFTAAYLPKGDYTLALTCQTAADDPDQVDRISFLQVMNAEVTPNTDTSVSFHSDSDHAVTRSGR